MKEVIFNKQNAKRVFSLALVMAMILAMLPGMAVTADAAGVDDYLFDWEYYYNKYPDLQKAFGKNQAKLRNHYNTYGKKEGRCPSDVFDPVFYLNKYSDLKAAFGNDYKAAYNHFVNNGIREGRQASASFAIEVYKSNYVDLRNAFGTAASDNWEYIRHWHQYGRREGRNATTRIGANTNSGNTGTQTTTTMYVKTSNPNNKLNMRSSASTSASIVERLPYGMKLTVYSTANGWAKVKSANGNTGYVSTQYLSSSEPSNSTTSNTTSSAVRNRLDSIGNGSLRYNSNTVMKIGAKFTGTRAGEQCKGYAKNVFYLCFGITPGSTQSRDKGLNYLINSTSGMTKLGSVTNMTQSNISALFAKARPGDFVQMRRSHGGSHSAIVYSVTSSGVIFLEANLDNQNTVYLRTYSWADLCSKNVAMSVYTATNYNLK